MLSDVQTGNGTSHDKYILPMREQTEKTTFSCKDDWGKSLHLYWSAAEELVKNQDHTWPELTQL